MLLVNRIFYQRNKLRLKSFWKKILVDVDEYGYCRVKPKMFWLYRFIVKYRSL